MNLLTVVLILLGASTLSCAFVWAILRLGAWCDGRKW